MDLTTLRPTNTTAAAISEALQRAEAARAEAAQGERDAKQRRADLLLDGTPAQLATADKALTAARDLTERVEAMTSQLQGRFAAAERSEALSSVETARHATETARAAVSTWWAAEEAVLRSKIEEGLRLYKADSDAAHEHSWLRLTVAHRFPEVEALPHPAGYADDADLWRRHLASLLDA